MSYSTAARVMPRPNTRPVARTAPQPRLRVVAPRPKNSTARLAVLCIGLLVTGLIALLLLNISIANGAYTLTSLQKAQLQATENQQKLAEQVDTLSAPQQLAQRASALGMVPAPNTAFVDLSDGTVIGKAATAKAAPPPAAKAAAAPAAGSVGAIIAKGTATSGTAKTSKATPGTAKTGTAKTGTTSPTHQ